MDDQIKQWRYTIARSFTIKYWFSTDEVTASGLRSRVSAPCSWRRASSSSRRPSHLLCGGGAKHLIHIFRALLRDRIHLGLRHGDEEQHVTTQQVHCAVDHLRTHGGFGQIRDPENQRSPGLQASEQRSGAQVVRFARFSANLRQQFDHLAQVCRAAAGQQALLDRLAVGEQADAIAGEECELRQRHRGGAGMIEFGVFAQTAGSKGQSRIGTRSGDYARTHQPAAIEHDPHGLAALGLVLARDQVSAARTCGPADVAHVVAFAVVAQAFEVAPQAALARLAQLEVDLPAAREEYLLFFAGAQGGIDADGLLQGSFRPAFRKSERRAIANVELAGCAISALLRLYAISH